MTSRGCQEGSTGLLVLMEEQYVVPGNLDPFV